MAFIRALATPRVAAARVLLYADANVPSDFPINSGDEHTVAGPGLNALLPKLLRGVG